MKQRQMNKCYGIRIGRHAGMEIDIEAFGSTVERACDAALALAQDAFPHWRAGLPYGDLFVEQLVNLTEGTAPVPVPMIYRPPPVGLTHAERQVVMSALAMLIAKLEADTLKPVEAAADQPNADLNLEVAAIRSLADRFAY